VAISTYTPHFTMFDLLRYIGDSVSKLSLKNLSS
jgi:hypothetical protein